MSHYITPEMAEKTRKARKEKGQRGMHLTHELIVDKKTGKQTKGQLISFKFIYNSSIFDKGID